MVQEAGLETEGMAETTSQLQQKLLALTDGKVDIMIDENNFKNTTQILREISAEWENMTDVEQAAALELLGGKRQANTLSAIISNFDIVEDAIEASANSSGSALEENEKVLDSIQGRINLFNNALQTLWNNLLNDEFIKNIVSWGTKIIQSLDTTHGKILALVKAVALLMAYKKINPLDWIPKIAETFNTITNTDGGLKQFLGSLIGIAPVMKTVTAETIANTVAMQANNTAEQQAILQKMGLTGATGALNAEKKKEVANNIALAVTNGQMTTQMSQQMAAMLGYTISVDAAGVATATLDATTKSFMASNPIGWILAIISVVMVAVTLISQIPSKIERVKEKLSDVKSEISDTESEITSLNSELETTYDRIAELEALPSLSFIEQEELDKLKQTTEELERQKKIKEGMLASQEEEKASTAKEYIDSSWNSTGWNKKYTIGEYNGTIKEDTFGINGVDTTEALTQAINYYKAYRSTDDKYKNILAQWDDNAEDGNEALLEKYGLNSSYSKAYIEQLQKENQERMKNTSEGINMVLGDENFEDLEYGMSDEINTFLDEYYAYTLKWQQAQGNYVKSEAISSLFNSSSTTEMQELGKELQEITGDDSVTDKNQTILDKLGNLDGVKDSNVEVDKLSESYNRLKIAMKTVGVTAQDIADYFVLETGAFNSNTVDGIANQYQHMEGVINALKNTSEGTFTFEGVTYNWDDFFSEDDEGKLKANQVEFSKILKGMDEDSRETFYSIVESAVNGVEDLSQIDWDQALSDLNFDGINRTFDLLNSEFETLNNEMFAGAADDIDGMIDTVNELKAALEDVASTMDLVHTAQQQMNSSGQISVKTALELMQTTEDWDSILEITNGTITLKDEAEQHLIQTELAAIQTQLHYAWQTAQTRYEIAQTSQAELEYASNSSTVMTAESVKAEAIGRVSAVIVALGAAMDEFNNNGFGNISSVFSNTYKSATATVVADAQQFTTTLADLEKDAENKRKLYETYSGSIGDSVSDFKNNYDYDKTPGDKYNDDSDSGSEDDAFQKAMDYWENRISANQARYEQLQNEIDLIEKQGGIAGEEYYQEQIKLENQRLKLLEAQKAEAKKYLGTFKEGSDEWWEAASQLNDIEGEIDSVTSSIQDLKDAIAQIQWDVFDESHTRFSNLKGQLETVRELVAPNGEEDWFDDEGMWTEKGVAVAGTYVQEIEVDQNALKDTQKKLADFAKGYKGNEKYFKDTYGLDSEQEYYDKRQELIEQEQEYTKNINSNKQAVVDMYEAQIDAVEEYTSKLVDSYNEYINLVKEALDAERDLYEFKKNVEKQTKDIGQLERRIASLSGSDNAADIAERRKLEAELMNAKEGLNDTYYDHAKDAQQKALEDEAAAYEETMNKFIEGLRESLDAALLDMDTFMKGVYNAVILNAPIILEEYGKLGIALDDAIIDPWTDAANAIKNFSGEQGLGLMNSWINEGGVFPTFKTSATDALKSPWTEGGKALTAFKNSVKTEMGNIISTIKNNVATAKSQLSSLYSQIQDTSNRAPSVSSSASSSSSNSSYTRGNSYDKGSTGSTESIKTLQSILNDAFFTNIAEDGKWGSKTEAALKKAQETISWYLGSRGYRDVPSANGRFDAVTHRSMKKYFELKIEDMVANSGGSSAVGTGVRWYREYISKLPPAFHAKGTLGTKKDEWAITDESWIGEEITLAAGKHGQLQYLKKGSAVMPADISANLIEWGKLNPNALTMPTMGGNVNIMSNAVIQPNYEFNFDSLVHVDHCDEGTLKGLEKMVDNKLDYFSRQLNYSIKKFSR